MELSDFKKTEPTIPTVPGIYKFFDNEGNWLYVGKAKNLRKRVASYFLKNKQSGKIELMVRKISKMDFTIVETEQDALLLENTIIKEYQPRYNISLKDDKSYPYICLKKENFSRIFSTRKLIKDGSEYFGPFSSGLMVNSVLEMIKNVFPLRNCNLKLTPQNITDRKFKVCLEYHLGNCKGPCESLQSVANYEKNIAQIRNILKGNIHSVIQYFTEQMNFFADRFEFENAEEVKRKLHTLQNYQSKSTVVNPKINNVDVFSIVEDEKYAFVNYLKVVNGAIIQTKTIELVKQIEENKTDLLTFAVNELRQQFKSEAKEIIVPAKISIGNSDLSSKNITTTLIKINVPKKGDKKKLLELSEKNALYFKSQKLMNTGFQHFEPLRKLQLMQTDLRMKDLPIYIECFDNSNMQGSFPVASLVAFKNAKPSKKDYRHFNIKSVEGPNDFASMEEVVYRRYKNFIDTQDLTSLPQLIIIDGGKGQLSSAMKSLEKLNIGGKVAVIGIAKKLEEIYLPGDSLPLMLNKKSETLRLIQQIRDEAHRFAITFHRNKRSKEMVKSSLINIKGIGENTLEKLLKKFKSMKKIKNESYEEIKKIIGESRAKILFEAFGR